MALPNLLLPDDLRAANIVGSADALHPLAMWERDLKLPDLVSKRFTVETGVRISVQVPDQSAQQIVDAVLKEHGLKYGDYDSVTYRSVPGIQQFRSLGTGRNAAIADIVEVPCAELSFFIEDNEALLIKVIESVYWAGTRQFCRSSPSSRHSRGLH